MCKEREQSVWGQGLHVGVSVGWGVYNVGAEIMESIVQVIQTEVIHGYINL